MKLRLTEKQINRLLTQITENQEVIEQDTAGTDPESAKPSAGTSSQQSGGKGYPEVGKWESGITRGPANQLGVTKWSDIVGGGLKRGKANQLKEQQSNWEKEKHKYVTDYERRELQKSSSLLDRMDNQWKPFVDFYNKHNHDVNAVLGLSLAMTGPLGLVIAMGIGGVDALQYWNEGDKKTAGLVAMFTLLPFLKPVLRVIPTLSKLGPKGMSELGKKVATKKTITNIEADVLINIGKNRQLIQSEMIKIGKDASIKLAKENVKQQLKKEVMKNQLKSVGKTVLGYGAAGVAYDQTYDYFQRKQEEEDLRKLNQMLGIKN